MDEIYEWIKRMIYLTIFLTLLLQILPKGSYRKYVKFFAGLVFVITVLNPLMGILQQENWEEELLNGLLYEESVREGELDFDYMEERQKKYYEKSMGMAVREVAEQAAEYGHSQKREYAFLIAHSMLHLMGYDHMTPQEAAVMEEKQREILEGLEITR